MCINEREVSEWTNYSEMNVKSKIDNIIYLKICLKSIDIINIICFLLIILNIL